MAGLTFVGLAAGDAGQARAASAADDAATASLKKHYEQGAKYYNIGKYDEAIKEFEAAYEAKSDPLILYNLAQAHRLAGHNTEALRIYKNHLRAMPDSPYLADVQKHIAALEEATKNEPPPQPPATGGPVTPPPPVTPPTTTTPGTQGTGAPVTLPGTPPPTTQPPAGPGDTGGPATTYPPVETAPPPPADVGGMAPPPPMIEQPGPAPKPGLSGRQKAGIVIAAIGAGSLLLGGVFGAIAKSSEKKVETASDNFDAFESFGGQARQSVRESGIRLLGPRPRRRNHRRRGVHDRTEGRDRVPTADVAATRTDGPGVVSPQRLSGRSRRPAKDVVLMKGKSPRSPLPSGTLSWLAPALALALTGCTYDPQIGDGTLSCGPNRECPSGYECKSSGAASISRCYEIGGPGPGGGTGGAGGTIGGTDGGVRDATMDQTLPLDASLSDAIPPTVFTQYIGTWVMGSNAQVHTVCDDGFDKVSTLTGSGDMTIERGPTGVADLSATWLCQLYLRLDTAGAHLFDSNPSCIDDSDDPKFTWTSTAFEFRTNDGVTATHTAKYNRLDEYMDGTVANCTQDVSATLTKN